MVPPWKYNKTHPGWFGGEQLCWGNDSLVQFVTQVVLRELRKQPEARFISVSQNDAEKYCERDADMAIINEEGGAASGPLLRALNTIGLAVEQAGFTRVTIETLAAGYSLRPPKKTKARHNIRVQWRYIGNAAVPITHPGNTEWRKVFLA